jgi:hypothetical protein
MSSSKTNWKPLLVIAVLLGTLVVCCVGPQVLWIYQWRDTMPRVELAEPTDWPEPIRDLHGATLEADIGASSFGVYLLYGQPRSTLSRVVCRMDASEEARGFLAGLAKMFPRGRAG